MAQIEMLCDRVAFLESGKIEAMGDMQHMDRKYGGCYHVIIRLPLEKRNSVSLINRIYFAMMEFHQCEFMYNYKGTLKFNVGKTYTTWGELFSLLVSTKEKEKLPEFSVSDIPPEEIFVGLSRRQLFFSFRRPRTNLSRMPSHVDSPPAAFEEKRK
ncbi:uncharacterized protein LOC125759748 [Rhipicephalus sanguineus]|uniref:uncharacterized protein LOC125759748 n=1 Tax=Rhipicephalus sanguineus TaxID=34632 RepID=UPI0020C45737|nr:uncharacterized protein LOC125759748 [Rhipicephalus sanguineus]